MIRQQQMLLLKLSKENFIFKDVWLIELDMMEALSTLLLSMRIWDSNQCKKMHSNEK